MAVNGAMKSTCGACGPKKLGTKMMSRWKCHTPVLGEPKDAYTGGGGPAIGSASPLTQHRTNRGMRWYSYKPVP
eukprot:scaffold71330_cov32-Tisochrysis_lutea.AAC.3